MAKLKYDETGKVYGRLTVISHVGSGYWMCTCSCGNQTTVGGSALRTGYTSSCGCLHREIMSETLTSHGMTDSAPYRSYKAARSRCENKNNKRYRRYGGRGIRFLLPDFPEFWAQLGGSWFRGATLGRVDNDGHYEMSNVRWETRQQQSENRSTNVQISYGGKTLLLRDWLSLLGISNHMYRNHVAAGRTFSEMIEYYKSDEYLWRRSRGGAGERYVFNETNFEKEI